jgi:putative endonuclease
MRILQKLLKKREVANITSVGTQADLSPNLVRGRFGEDLAVEYLKKRGYKLLGRNVRYTVGELDIVVQKDGETQFVEVKTRKSPSWGEAVEHVTAEKQKRIKRAAQIYLSELYDRTGEEPPCGFMVIGVDLSGDEPNIDCIESAFE